MDVSKNIIQSMTRRVLLFVLFGTNEQSITVHNDCSFIQEIRIYKADASSTASDCILLLSSQLHVYEKSHEKIWLCQQEAFKWVIMIIWDREIKWKNKIIGWFTLVGSCFLSKSKEKTSRLQFLYRKVNLKTEVNRSTFRYRTPPPIFYSIDLLN